MNVPVASAPAPLNFTPPQVQPLSPRPTTLTSFRPPPPILTPRPPVATPTILGAGVRLITSLGLRIIGLAISTVFMEGDTPRNILPPPRKTAGYNQEVQKLPPPLKSPPMHVPSGRPLINQDLPGMPPLYPVRVPRCDVPRVLVTGRIDPYKTYRGIRDEAYRRWQEQANELDKYKIKNPNAQYPNLPPLPPGPRPMWEQEERVDRNSLDIIEEYENNRTITPEEAELLRRMLEEAHYKRRNP